MTMALRRPTLAPHAIPSTLSIRERPTWLSEGAHTRQSSVPLRTRWVIRRHQSLTASGMAPIVPPSTSIASRRSSSPCAGRLAATTHQCCSHCPRLVTHGDSVQPTAAASMALVVRMESTRSLRWSRATVLRTASSGSLSSRSIMCCTRRQRIRRRRAWASRPSRGAAPHPKVRSSSARPHFCKPLARCPVAAWSVHLLVSASSSSVSSRCLAWRLGRQCCALRQYQRLLRMKPWS
mmetsp:Transcript_69963/g.192034  ORF Transcript_69963/g.192034 Transcript_69963/m.192034 type:complete len:236 (+) Transcript_69963:758-1465(+)